MDRDAALAVIEQLHAAQASLYTDGDPSAVRSVLHPDIAWHVSRGWPDAERLLVADAGHGHGVEGRVVAATDRFAGIP